MRLFFCAEALKRAVAKRRIDGADGKIKNTPPFMEMYALSDFLIMVFVMVSEAVT